LRAGAARIAAPDVQIVDAQVILILIAAFLARNHRHCTVIVNGVTMTFPVASVARMLIVDENITSSATAAEVDGE
jgi:hypothetical protein